MMLRLIFEVWIYDLNNIDLPALKQIELGNKAFCNALNVKLESSSRSCLSFIDLPNLTDIHCGSDSIDGLVSGGELVMRSE